MLELKAGVRGFFMKKYNYMRVLITTLVVIIGISGIAWFTWHLGKMFVGLVSTSPINDSSDKIEQTSSKILTLPPINLWTCQVGVFKERKNADQMIESLKLKGWKAEIIQKEPYTVAVGAFNQKEKAILLGNILAEEGIPFWIKEETFPALHYKVSGKNVERITVMLTLANSLLGGTERDKIRDELAGDKEFLFAGVCPTDFQRLSENLRQILDSKYANSDITGPYHQDLLVLFMEYQSVTTKYFKNSK